MKFVNFTQVRQIYLFHFLNDVLIGICFEISFSIKAGLIILLRVL